MKKKIMALMAVSMTLLMISASGISGLAGAETWPPETWEPGDEKDPLNGKSFDDEYWTTDISNTSAEGTKYTFTASYVNHQNVQAFLVAFNKAEKNDTVSTLPYQFFGMHYYTPLGTEVFLGSVLAFLMAYNDTYNGNGTGQNGVMDPGNEDVYYIIPYGLGDLPMFEDDDSYVPEVSAIPAKKISEGEYEFGMTYKNLYAKIVDGNSGLGFILSAALPLYIAKFSELTVKYHIKMDKEKGEITAETFYTLGQVDKLWLLGQEVSPDKLPETMGISAVHFVTIFNSKYATYDNAGKSLGNLQAGRTETVDEVQMKVGEEERAFDVGFRGEYDLIDEKNGNQMIKENEKAYNLLLGARLNDLLLVAWQGKISVGLMAYFAYGLSEDIRADYDGPYDLAHNASGKFWGAAFWYAVAFPEWEGYRVEHDPVFTAYSSFEEGSLPADTPERCSSIIMATVGIAGLASCTGFVRYRRRRRD